MARKWGQPPANNQQETKALSPTALKELNSVNNQVNLEVSPSPVKTLDKTTTLANALIAAL